MSHGCQMAIAGFLERMCLALRASGLWLRYAALQNLIPSFPWIAPPRPLPWRNPRKGRDQILPSGNLGWRHVLCTSGGMEFSTEFSFNGVELFIIWSTPEIGSLMLIYTRQKCRFKIDETTGKMIKKLGPRLRELASAAELSNL